MVSKYRYYKSISLILLIIVSLTACGGGGGGGSLPETDSTPPVILKTEPASGEIIPVNSFIKITFSEAIQLPETVDVDVYPFRPDGSLDESNPVPLATAVNPFSFDTTLKVLTIRTNADKTNNKPFIKNTKYQVNLRLIKDSFGNKMAGICRFEFATDGYDFRNISKGKGICDTPEAKQLPGNFAFEAASTSISENNTTTVNVIRQGGSDGTVTVKFSMSGGNATPILDYEVTDAILIFNEGELSKPIPIKTTADNELEGDEFFNIILSNVTGGASIGDPTPHVVTIIDNNSPQPGTLSFARETSSVDENKASKTILVTRSGGSNGRVTIDYKTFDGTAKANTKTVPADYSFTSGTLIFDDGVTQKSITIPITVDNIVEPQKSFTVKLSNAVNTSAPGTFLTHTITINDTSPPDVTAPVISALKPIPGKTNFAQNSTVNVTFNEKITVPTSANIAIRQYSANGSIDLNSLLPITNANLTVSSDSQTLIFTPNPLTNTGLLAATKYRVLVSGVKDLAGNIVSGSCFWDFATTGYTPANDVSSVSSGTCRFTGASPDTRSPTIVSLVPANETAIAATDSLSISFSEAMNETTLQSNIELQSLIENGCGVAQQILPNPYSYSYDAASNTVNLTANTTLPGQIYQLVIRSGSTGVKDISGNSLAIDKSVIFNTKPKANNAPGSLNQWTWVRGCNKTDNTGTYGTIKLNATSNMPSARVGSAHWKDNSGNFWMMGGEYFDPTISFAYLNDLWKFDLTTNQWTWMHGSSGTHPLGVFGTINTPAATNEPPGRSGAASWVDLNGNFWLMGGLGAYSTNDGYRNDLWKFNGSQWSWESGSQIRNQIGIYGVQKTANAKNDPGSRKHSISWTDSQGNLWLIGGEGFNGSTLSTTTFGVLNDIWKFDGTDWTWMFGSKLADQAGVYTDPSIYKIFPGGRSDSASWFDSKGNLWVLGGYGVDKNGAKGLLNDLWKFDGNFWYWMKGSDVINQSGVYGTVGVAADANLPGARKGATTWIDSKGILWLFGGEGYGSNQAYYVLNDLWKYDPTTNQWTWLSDPNSKFAYQGGSYGTRGVTASTNIPNTRYKPAYWIDANDNLWLFGGNDGISSSQAELNDLWQYSP